MLELYEVKTNDRGKSRKSKLIGRLFHQEEWQVPEVMDRFDVSDKNCLPERID